MGATSSVSFLYQQKQKISSYCLPVETVVVENKWETCIQSIETTEYLFPRILAQTFGNSSSSEFEYRIIIVDAMNNIFEATSKRLTLPWILQQPAPQSITVCQDDFLIH